VSAHQIAAPFLRYIIPYEDSDEPRKLEKRIAQVQRDERCVRRFASVMTLFLWLAIVGVGYETMLQKNFPYDASHPGFRVLCEIGLASLTCLVTFAGLLMGYRKRLRRLREECRQLATRLLEPHLAEPDRGTFPGSHPGADAPGAFEGAAEVSGYDGSLNASSWRSNRLCG
jgi:hypothetical protein